MALRVAEYVASTIFLCTLTRMALAGQDRLELIVAGHIARRKVLHPPRRQESVVRSSWS